MRAWMPLEGRDQAPPEPSDAELAAAVRRYAWPLAPLAVFGWLSGMGDRYVIAGLLSLHDAGLYAAACGLASRPFLMLGGIVELTMRPVLQNAVAVGDAALIARAKTTWLLVIACGATFGVICFVLLSGWAGRLLLAEQYRSATALMPWIALGYALYNMATVYTRFCYAFDDTKAVSSIVVCGTLLGVAVMVPAIYFGALFGAGYSVPVGFGAQLILAFVLARRAEMSSVGHVLSARGVYHREA
jgi:O-antigen/teichoic acid export membrane protein